MVNVHTTNLIHSPACARMDKGARLLLHRRVFCRLGAQRTPLAFMTLVCMVAVWCCFAAATMRRESSLQNTQQDL